MKYIKLLRLQDQYLTIGIILGSNLVLHKFYFLSIYWVFGATFISIVSFILNELVDRNDVDEKSWNPVHIGKINLNSKIVGVLIVGFSIAGLYYSYLAGLFILGLAMYLIGVLYSLPPFRFKIRFAIDVIAQLLLGVILPGLGPFILEGKIIYGLYLSLPIAFIIWGSVLPYQLADFEEDRKAGFHNTHIVLGFRNSLYFGLLFSLLGLIFFFIFKLQKIAPWSVILAIVGVYSVYKYVTWMRDSNFKSILLSMQKYVLLIKPISQLFIPYLLILMYQAKLIPI